MARYGTCRYGTRRYSEGVATTIREVSQRMDFDVPPDEDVSIDVPVGSGTTSTITLHSIWKRVIGRQS